MGTAQSGHHRRSLANLIEQIDTTTPGGKLIFHIFGALGEFERELIRERTMAGLAAARARGRQGGRPKKLTNPKQIAMAQALYDSGEHSIADICQTLGISRATLYRAIKPGPRMDRRNAFITTQQSKR